MRKQPRSAARRGGTSANASGADTSFFRGRESFDELQATALTDVLKHKAAGAPIRAWVVGCSTGEEVYSLAMSILEVLDDASFVHPVHVFGSDLCAKAIEHARGGLYSEATMRELGEERRSRFFVESERGWRIAKALREVCVFARHDVARDPPFSRVDVVSCRDVLGHFGRAIRKRVLETFHHSLNQPGYLLLGDGETVASAARLFAPASATGRLFVRKPRSSTSRPTSRAGGVPFVREPLAREPQAQTLESLGSLLEEHGRANDALASANTEFVSLNEELRSTNEELETAKEELQATNEELTESNDELNGRNRELQLLNDDLVSLLEAIEVPVVMLDSSRRIRRFTLQAGALLNLTSAALGKPLGDVALELRAPDLDLWVAQAMQTGAMVESEVQDRAERWHRMRIRPQRAPGGRVDGAIVSLVDIHALKHDVADAERERDRARSMSRGPS